MEYSLVLLISAFASFFVHDFLEKKYIGPEKRNVRLIVKGYHVHHSFFGVMFLVGAVVIGGGYPAIVCCGYAVGNIWQHKITHNRVNEKGMVFITRETKSDGPSKTAGRI